VALYLLPKELVRVAQTYCRPCSYLFALLVFARCCVSYVVVIFDFCSFDVMASAMSDTSETLMYILNAADVLAMTADELRSELQQRGVDCTG